MTADAQRGYTPRELAKLLRVSPDKVRSWILRGDLGAVNTASTQSGRPRFVILPHHLAVWEQGRQAARPVAEIQRKHKRLGIIDFYPD